MAHAILFSLAFGVDPVDLGWMKLRVKPQAGSLGSAKGKVPEGSAADLSVPDGESAGRVSLPALKTRAHRFELPRR